MKKLLTRWLNLRKKKLFNEIEIISEEIESYDAIEQLSYLEGRLSVLKELEKYLKTK